MMLDHSSAMLNLPGPLAPLPSPRERLLRAAAEIFCRHGINAVGVDRVVEAAGTAKTTLYKLFGSKDGLVEAVLESEGSAWRAWFLGRIEAAAATPRGRLEQIFPILDEWFRGEQFYGCPFINAVGEHDKQDQRIRNLAIAHKHIVLERLRGLAVAAGAADATVVAAQIGLLIDGAIVAALISRDPAVAVTADRTLRLLLDMHLPRADLAG
jgi:AcrR family transcriptional regulator